MRERGERDREEREKESARKKTYPVVAQCHLHSQAGTRWFGLQQSEQPAGPEL